MSQVQYVLVNQDEYGLLIPTRYQSELKSDSFLSRDKILQEKLLQFVPHVFASLDPVYLMKNNSIQSYKMALHAQSRHFFAGDLLG